MLKESCLQATEEIALIPFVISNKPDKSPEIKLGSICRNLKKGVKNKVKLCNNPAGF